MTDNEPKKLSNAITSLHKKEINVLTKRITGKTVLTITSTIQDTPTPKIVITAHHLNLKKKTSKNMKKKLLHTFYATV